MADVILGKVFGDLILEEMQGFKIMVDDSPENALPPPGVVTPSMVKKFLESALSRVRPDAMLLVDVHVKFDLHTRQILFFFARRGTVQIIQSWNELLAVLKNTA